jgi:hypothetical protein
MHLVLNMFIFTRKLVTYTHTQEPSSIHVAASTFKVCARKRVYLHFMFGQFNIRIPWYNSRHTLISGKRDGKPRMTSDQFVVVRVGVHQLSVSPNTSHPMLRICNELLHGNSTPSLNSSYLQLTSLFEFPVLTACLRGCA